MSQISDQKRLELAYKKILKLEEKLKDHTESKAQSLDSSQIPVAVIGAACRYPGGINNLADLWNQFANGNSSIGAIPAKRWDLAEIFSENRDEPNKTYCQYGSFFESIDEFDPHFFNISSKEAERMDPQQRLFLQGCWEAFEDAGYNDSRLSGVKCGVYAGSLNCDYTNVLNATPHEMDLFELMGTQASILSARISYLLNLKGPSITIDTACSSSLIAVELAVKAIQAGDIELALAGGVHLYITPNLYIMMSKAQMLSEDGNSKAFDNSANGFVPGEGMSVILLKRLDKAIADGDQIYGVILGGVSNQDGKTNGITAPSSLAQTQLQLEAYQKLNVSPASIGYMEAHGTGTKLGDPIEFEALSKSFRHYTDQSHFCALGSSKTNFGHTLSAAGVTGVLKAMLAMKHKKIPANLNFQTVNEHLDYENSPFYINNQLVDWPQPSASPRRSAVSSYGFSGTNAHLVMEEAPLITINQDVIEPSGYLILLSAKTESALVQKIADLCGWVEKNPEAKVKDISLTLMRGRCHFKYRTGFVVNSYQDLINQLKSWVPSKTKPDIKGVVSELLAKIVSANNVEPAEYRGNLQNLLNFYVAGQDAEWQTILASGARSISLPTYPFEKEKYWIKAKADSVNTGSHNSESAFSLVDVNESTLEVQCYKKTFTGDEFYLKDHMINLRKILPGVAYLEMARSSGNLCNIPHKVTRIENVVWRNPIEVSDGPQTVKISLHPVDDQVDFQIFSTLNNSVKGTIHCTGRLSYHALDLGESEKIDIDLLRKELPEFMSQKQCYDSFQEKGMLYGSSFKRILNLNFKNNRALASIEGRDNQKDIDALHPGIVDASMQAVLILVNQRLGNLHKHYLPHSMDSLEIYHPLTPRCYSVVTHRENLSGQDNAEYFDVTLTNEEGLILLKVSGLKLVQIKRTMDSMANVADYLYYRNIFTPAPLNTLDPVVYNQNLAGKNKPSLLLIGNAESFSRSIDLPLLQQYFSITSIKITSDNFQVNEDSIALSLNELDHVKLLLKELTVKNIKPEYVAWLDCRDKLIDGENENQVSTQLIQFQICMIRELLQSRLVSNIRFISTETKSQASIQSGASTTAFYKTLALENPGYLGKHIVFAEVENKGFFSQQLVNELLNAKFNPHLVMYKDKMRYKNHIEQITESSIPQSDVAIPVFKQDGVYLLTGGLKGIGFVLAKEIISQHDLHLVLTGRSPLTAEQQQALNTLNNPLQKGSVQYLQANVNSLQDLHNLKATIISRYRKLNGILHCAGVKKDAFIFNKQNQDVIDVILPKINGTLNLDTVFHDQPLDFFILFSSIAAVFGNPGQADYAYANGFLDDFAVYRNSLVASGNARGKTLSINWPLWSEGGMQLDEVTSKSMHDLFGMLPIDARQGLRCIEVCLHLDESSVMHMYGDQQKTAKALKNWIHEDKQQKIALLNDLTDEQRERVKKETEHYFKLLISDEMKTPYEKLESDAPFEHFGMDSVVYMSLNKKLEEGFGKVSKTLFYEYQNIEALAEYFVKNYFLQLIEVTGINLKVENANSYVAPVISPIEEKSVDNINFVSDRFRKSYPSIDVRKNTDIAIVGISGRYPQSDNLEEFWKNLVDKKDCIEEIPLERWDHSAYFSEERGVAGKTYSRWGGFVKGHDEFDALFFNVSPKEASLIDPQERLFLQTSWQAIADAGYTGKSLSNCKVGVYAGVMWSQYQLLGVDPAYETQGSVPESLISSVANRVSYYFDFHGPSVGLDTMCSSSLTAIHMACEAIKSGEIDYALAGGVNLIVHPNKYLRLAQGNFASSDGRCRSFGAGGTGYVPGEGVGVVLLKSLEQAIADKDHIYGVIKASHINHGGKTNGYTVPNPVQQAELIKKSLEKAKINPEAISYVEAHGTGTELGDPIEITGLSQAYSAQSPKRQYCALGSVKSNIGHLESAAGVSGLTKILLQLKHDLLVPSLHCDQVNPNIDLESSPFYLQKELTSWTGSLRNTGLPRTKRCAAISSFGAGGSNSHLIIEESPLRNKQIDHTKKTRIFIFSAKDESRLRGYINHFIRFLETEKEKVSLDDVAYTLQAGRDMEVERLAVIADNHDILIQQLKTYQSSLTAAGIFNANASGANKDNSFLPSGETGREYINSLIKHREFSKVAALWVQGAVIDWSLLQSGTQAYRIPMPVAPFQTSSFWINRRSDAVIANAIAHASLHSLIDQNISTFDQQAYTKTFKTSDAYLKHHRVLDKALLPGAAYFEIARVAAHLAGANHVSGFENVQWQNPLYVKEPIETAILLEPSTDKVVCEIVANNNWQQVYASGELILEKNNSIQLQNKKAAITNLRSSSATKTDASHFYEKLSIRGFQYSGVFKSLESIVIKGKELAASINNTSRSGDIHLSNIVVIDAAFQSLFALIEQLDPQSQTQYVPSFCNRLIYTEQDLSIASDLYGQLKYQDEETGNLVFDIHVCDENGNCLVAVHDFVVAAIANKALPIKTSAKPEVAYWVENWKTLPVTSAVVDYNKIYIDFGKKQPVGFKGLHLAPDTQFIQVDAQSIKADLSQVNSWKRILNQLTRNNEKPELQIVIATAADDHDHLLSEIFKTVKSLSISLMDNSSISFVHLTLLVEDYPFNPVKALTGMLKSLQQENSRIVCSSLEYAKDISDENLLNIINMDSSRRKTHGVSVMSRYRNEQFFVQQYIPVTASENPVRHLKTGGSYLITGGAQGIGKIVAEYLAKEYQANLILVGRSGHNESVSRLLQELKNLGSEAVYFSADVTNRDEMQSVIEKSLARLGCLNGVIHSAGCTRDSWIFNKTQADFDAVISPKIYGTRIIDEVTADLDLDIFVVFSSLASIIGNAGQTDYALANNYLDLFAHDRSQQVSKGERSGKTLAINWPYWAQGGMQLSADNLQKLREETGLMPLPNETGLAALEFCLAQHDTAQIAVSYGDSEILNNLFQDNHLNQAVSTAIHDVDNSIASEINTDDARSWVVNQIKSLISAETKWDLNKIVLTESFGTYGIDSVMTLNITRKLSGIFGELPKTLFFEYQNVKALSDYFVKQHIAVIAQKINQDKNHNPHVKVDQFVAQHSLPGKSIHAIKHNRRQTLMSSKQSDHINNREPVAIIGLAGRYPDAENIQEFYRNLLAGRDSIQEIPEWRWDNKKYFNKNRHATGKNYSQWGGFIEHADQFDPLFFNVSPTDAITMDPQERLFLESSWNCIEDAGYTKTQMANSRTGVFAGIMWSHYHFSGIDTEPVQSKKYPESNYASVANRVSYWFGFTGPSMTIDTMCSSSLTAIHLACEAIRNNQCEMAIAGGVNLTLHPYKYLQLSGSQFLSTDGRCRSFGEGGDGYVPGEGVGSVLLKPLSKALADKDHIYGVINASSINHGGKSNGYNVPNPQAQAALIREAIDQSSINPADISYIEAHGTGTPLGDPIELQGLKKAFDGIEAPVSCALGSVKSNIGHLEAASGIAGLTKVLLQMKTKKLFPSLHAETLNPNLDFANSSFRVNTQLDAWQPENNRLVAGISSFGAGGSNAFLLVEAGTSNKPLINSSIDYPVVVPISARNEDSLIQYLQKLIDFLDDIKTGQSLFANTHDFASIVKTLQTGKTIFQSRIAIITRSLDDLLSKLKAAIAGDQSVTGIYRGFAEMEMMEEGIYDEIDSSMIDIEKLNILASYWAEGGNVNFAKIFNHIDGCKIPLPTYCFDKKSYWYKGNSLSFEKIAVTEETGYSRLLTNQLLLESVDFERSTQNGLTFKSRFTMEHEVVFNHQFDGRELLPGAAYIVMLKEALDSFDLKSKNQLSNVRWQSPIFVDSPVDVFTTIERHQEDCRYKIWTDGDRPRVHGVGELHHSNASISIDWSRLNEKQLTSSISQNDFYELFNQYNLAYSGPYRSIQNVRFNATEAIVDYAIKSSAKETTSVAEVAILDACLQIFVLFHERVSSEVKLPFSIDKLLFVKKPSLIGKLYVTQVHDDTGNVVVVDENGDACIALEGINFQAVNKPSVKSVSRTDKVSAVADGLVAIKNQLTTQVRNIFVASLQMEDVDLKNKVTFDQYGMESVKAMEITHELEKLYGRLPSTLLYEYQTISSLVDFIFAEKQDVLKKQTDVEKSVENFPVTNLPAESGILKDNDFEFSGEDLKQKIDQLADHEVDSLLNALLN